MSEPGCLDDDSALAFAEGTLAEDARGRAEEHLDGCALCRKLLAALALSSPSPSRPSSLSPEADQSASPRIVRGTVVGRFVIIGPIGAGGMGVVYAAYDPELDRKVALKLLHRRAAIDDGASGRAQLIAEAKAMAKLMHPNVVAIHDVGLHGEQVWIAMEFVDGENVRRWLRTATRSTEAIVDVFLAGGRGLVAAHDAGLVHRDFKSDNLLISNTGTAKVTDFGLALARKAAEDSPPPATATATRVEIAGTPAYMSPEQREGHDLDARSDQYSFAAALYEALYLELPPLPSGGDEAPAFPERAGISRPVERVLRRALSRDRERRFPSLEAMLSELVEAPRRRRFRILGALGVVLTLAIGGGLSYRASLERSRLCTESEGRASSVWNTTTKAAVERRFASTKQPFALAAWSAVERSIGEYVRGWVEDHRAACVATRVRNEQSEETYALRSACLSRRLEELGALTELLQVADETMVEQALNAVTKLTPLAACKSTTALSMQPLPPAGAEARGQASSLRRELAEGKALLDAGKYRDGARKVDACVSATETLGYLPIRAEALYLQGALREQLSDLKGAEQSLFQAAEDAETTRHDEVAAKARTLLVWVIGYREARYEVGDVLAREAHAAILRAGSRPDLAAPLENNLGTLLWAQGYYARARERHDEARALWERALGPENPRVADSINNRALALWSEGKLDEALASHEQALALRMKLLGPEHPAVASSLNNIGLVAQDLGRFEYARERHQRAIDIQTKVYGPVHPNVANAVNNLGLAELGLGDPEEALRTLTRAFEIRKATREDSHPDIANSLVNLALAYLALGQTDKAMLAVEDGYARQAKALGPDQAMLVETLIIYSNVLRTKGRTDDALVRAVEAEHLAMTRLGPEHPLVSNARVAIARSLIRLGRASEAVPILEPVLARVESSPDSLMLGEAAFAMARAVSASANGRATPHFLELARAKFRLAGARGQPRLTELEEFARRR